ncbi:MAG: hypothetical protein ACD_57C00399G0001 [uncultured bacterium]|uniref:Uncharacterized protein n=1 Tax=Candidatus Woesebacteria bacterium RIFCSPLOWO2_01_FULL_39_21 TaxID=1802519 RepID=A0A1F8BDU6_9BACT|nr:MAG: hypothetical protein ACD_57C00399G0001 [uncultured bacterium]OGM22128.1 MAG: hypothetical protein A2691_03520 [Candidatus Woesebacteria bacterium RIFCSPHIGHO2_01_FULL_39_23]OGM62130.1 MAG: hypothetical protein A2961_05145 [Candidatus Woesebacteria bacterium RIFCSPLOWO2_01_FULL_39_21]
MDNNSNNTSQKSNPNLDDLSQGVPEDMKLDQVPSDIAELPHVVTQPLPSDQNPSNQGFGVGEFSQKRRGFKVFPIGLILFFALLLLAGGGLYAVAYERVDLGNKNLQKSIASLVQGLPFTPKTPRYVLEKAYDAQKNVDSVSFNLSVALSSGSFSMLGLGSIDMQFMGDLDYRDLDNLKTKLNLTVLKEFNMDIISINDKSYLRVNKVPSLILSFIGISNDQVSPFLGRWIEVNKDELLGVDSGISTQGATPSMEEEIQKSLELILEEKVLSNLEMTEESLDGKKSYKFHFQPNSELFDYIMEKLSEFEKNGSKPSDYKASEFLKDLKVDLWVDGSSFYITKVSMSTILDSGTGYSSGGVINDDPLSILGNSQQFDVAIVMLLTNHGKDLNISAPSGAEPLDQFMKSFESMFVSEYNLPSF